MDNGLVQIGKLSSANLGTVISVRGSVVDVRFDKHLPSIRSLLRAGNERRIVIEVLAQRDASHVRGIALFSESSWGRIRWTGALALADWHDVHRSGTIPGSSRHRLVVHAA